MAIFASTTLGSSDPLRAQSIKALEARAQALQAAQAKQELPTSMPSPWQGAGYLANTLADSLAIKRADLAAAQRQKDLQGYVANLGDNPTMAQVAPIAGADPEFAKTIMAEIQQRRLAAQKSQDDLTYLQKQDEYARGRPQSDQGKVMADPYLSDEQKADAIKKLNAGSAAEQKLAGEQQNQNIELQGGAQAINDAMDLLKTGKVYSDSSLADLRTQYGQSVPKSLQGIAGVDPESTDISKRYDQIIKMQVMPILNQLKGSMSNADREWAMSTINNPSSTVDAKMQVLTRLKTLMDAHLKQSNINLEQSGKTAVQIQPGGGGGGTKADPLAEARDVIGKHPDLRDKVIQRLKENNIDPSGL